jgi:DedD protein
LPDETVETPEKSNGTAFTDMENPPPPPSEDDEAEGMDPDAPADEGSPPDADTGSVPPSSPPAASLDTGEVREVAPPVVKAPTRTNNTLSKPESNKPPKKTPAPAAKPTVASKPAPVPATPAPAPSKPAKAAGDLSRFYIQAGSFSKKDNAQSLADTIRKQGMPVLLETIQTSKGTMYRLRVGPELDKKRAVAMKSKLDQQNIKGILVAE